ncbi:hypothetical protein ACHAO3_009088 [Verticillium nonalfalfae]
MLLTHTVGLGYDLADPDLVRWSQYIGRKDTNLDWSLDGFDTPFKFAPGEGWYYGTAVDWAGQLLEALTGNTIEAYMQDHVLDPLEMRDTGFWPGKLDHVQDRAVAWSCRGDDKTSLSPGPKLTPTTHEISDMLNAIAGQFHDMFAPEFPANMRLDHGLGGIINMADVGGKRRKGSLSWCGMCNGRWWIDREAGIAAVLVVNVLPLGDPVVNKLLDELERAVYGGLLHAKQS